MSRSARRVALVHYWLLNKRGGERVLEQLAQIFPSADVYTLLAKADVAHGLLPGRQIYTSLLQRVPLAPRVYRYLLPFYPIALEQFDLSAYDLVISSESGPAKGVVTSAATIHICYCHTPMRHLWDHYHLYRTAAGPIARLVMAPLFQWFRMWDVLTANRVDQFVANSRTTQQRIAKHYRRRSVVVYPPVRTTAFPLGDSLEDYYLFVGELVAYKRVDLAVEAFRRSGRRLVVVGRGPERRRLERLAPRNVEFLGHVSDAMVATLMSRCRAFVFPGEEDFGIAPVEAMAAGRPVVALGRGGVLESVVDGESGVLFDAPTVEALNRAIARLDRMEAHWDPQTARRQAARFDETVFRDRMAGVVEQVLRRRRGRAERTHG